MRRDSKSDADAYVLYSALSGATFLGFLFPDISLLRLPAVTTIIPFSRRCETNQGEMQSGVTRV